MISNNKIFNIENKSIFVAGHNGMVGSAILRQLPTIDKKRIITLNSGELD